VRGGRRWKETSWAKHATAWSRGMIYFVRILGRRKHGGVAAQVEVGVKGGVGKII